MKAPILAAAITFAGATGVQALDCADFIKMHGMATRAQFQCRFNQYNQEVIDEARTCYRQVGDDRGKDLLMTGMKQFGYSDSGVGIATTIGPVRAGRTCSGEGLSR